MIQVLHPLELLPEYLARLRTDNVRVATQCERAKLDEAWLCNRLEGLLLSFWGLIFLVVSVLNYLNKWLLELAETKVDDDLIADNDR